MGTNYSKLILEEFEKENPDVSKINNYKSKLETFDFYYTIIDGVRNNYIGIVKYISAIGDINDKILGKKNLLELSIKIRSRKIFMYIIDNYKNLNISDDVLCCCCEYNRGEFLKKLIQNGIIDINRETRYYKSLLHFCCQKQSVPITIIYMLLQNGADVNIKKYNETAFSYAMSYRDTSVLEILIKHGAYFLDIDLTEGSYKIENKKFVANKIREIDPTRLIDLPKELCDYDKNKCCPLCRKNSIFHKIFINEIALQCCICLEHSNNIYSGMCGHIVCGNCCKLISENPK